MQLKVTLKPFEFDAGRSSPDPKNPPTGNRLRAAASEIAGRARQAISPPEYAAHRIDYHPHNMPSDVQALLKTGAALTDQALERLLPSPDTPPHSIHRAMRHSTFAGGKRLRPILCIAAARMVSGGNALDHAASELGAAIEMIHTYSLIHDDLPALDNDDLRRGQPTCHKVFGEATAILAGDALQTLAFQTIAQLACASTTTVAILREISAAISTGVGTDLPGGLPPGMIGGQVMDLEGEGSKPTAELVERIHRAKTGALITVSVVSGGLLAGAGAHAVSSLRTFGEKAGLAFQIVDDVLDVTQNSAQLGKTAGKDTASDKATWPAVFGIEESIHAADELIADAFAALEGFGEDAAPLKALATYLTTRTN
jgi:geranylgeranyl diphosphate synthase type II